VRLARRADRARRCEVRAAAVLAGDGAVRRPPACRRPRRGQEDRGSLLMATDVKLPRLGQGMESGTIVRWLKSEGDTVEKGDALFEVDTDKATQEVEAEASGVLLRIAVAEGEVPVGETIATIGEPGEAVAAAQTPAAPAPAPAPAPAAEAAAELEPPVPTSE